MQNVQTIRPGKDTTTTTTDGIMDMIPVNPINVQHAYRENADKRRKKCVETQWGGCTLTSCECGKKSEKEAGGMIRNIVYEPLMVIFTMKMMMHIYVAI